MDIGGTLAESAERFEVVFCDMTFWARLGVVACLSEVAKLAVTQVGSDSEVSVATYGNTVILGTWWDDEAGFWAGAAYVFEEFELSVKLTGRNPRDYFGESVAISEKYWAIGAYGENELTGAVYVYPGPQRLVADDGGEDDYFGLRVAIEGETLVVGVHLENQAIQELIGSVYVFKGPLFKQTQKLQASDRARGDVFGYSLSLSGNRLAVGAPGDDEAGAVYIFEGDPFQETRKLAASDASEIFGFTVALEGTTLLVGAPQSNAIYVFDNFTQTRKVKPSDAVDDNFGFAVAMSGSSFVVGSVFDDDNGEDSGSAFVFNDFDSKLKLTATDAQAYDWFGQAVAISADLVVVTSPGERAAYCFATPTPISTSSKKRKDYFIYVLAAILLVLLGLACCLRSICKRRSANYHLEVDDQPTKPDHKSLVIEFTPTIPKGHDV